MLAEPVGLAIAGSLLISLVPFQSRMTTAPSSPSRARANLVIHQSEPSKDAAALPKDRRMRRMRVARGYVTVDPGIRLFYRKVSDGGDPVIVPLGFYLYEDFKRLAKNRTLIFYDMRNRGRSSPIIDGNKISIQNDVEDLEKVRQHFGLNRISLIGESYLGLAVIMYAMKYPEHVERIVQIGAVPLKFDTRYPVDLTTNDSKPVPDPVEQAKLNQLKKSGYDRSHPREFCERDWAVTRTMLVGNPANARMVRSPCEMRNEWPINFERHLRYHFASIQRLAISKEEVSKVSVPVLTIHGTKDRNAPYGGGREWDLMLPNARLLTITGAAHFPWIDAPEIVFPAIDIFLRGKWPTGAEKVRKFAVVDGQTESIKASPDAKAEQELRKLEHQWLDANADEIERIEADDFTITYEDGSVRNKAQYLAMARRAVRDPNVSQWTEDSVVRVYGDTAIITGRFLYKVRDKDKETTTESRYTDTYIRRNGSWQVVASHLSRIKNK